MILGFKSVSRGVGERNKQTQHRALTTYKATKVRSAKHVYSTSYAKFWVCNKFHPKNISKKKCYWVCTECHPYCLCNHQLTSRAIGWWEHDFSEDTPWRPRLQNLPDQKKYPSFSALEIASPMTLV